MSTPLKVPLLALAAAGLVAGGAVTAASSAASPTPPAPAAAAPAPPQFSKPIPGDNPSVQSWFTQLGPNEIALQNALHQAERDVAASSAHATVSCGALSRAAGAILARLPAPDPALNGPVAAGMSDLQAAAAACTRHDWAGASGNLLRGVSKRASAQDKIDEILDGDG